MAHGSRNLRICISGPPHHDGAGCAPAFAKSLFAILSRLRNPGNPGIDRTFIQHRGLLLQLQHLRTAAMSRPSATPIPVEMEIPAFARTTYVR